MERRRDAGQLANLHLGVDKSGGIRGARTSDRVQEVLLKQLHSSTKASKALQVKFGAAAPVFLNTVISVGVCSSVLIPHEGNMSLPSYRLNICV